MKHYDAIIIGAGAAGLMTALRAGQRGRRVVVLDHADQVGAKILISGGGRCNFTNRDARPDCYLSNNPSFCISALKSYTAHDFIKLVQKHNIAYHEKTLGQLFCDHSARSIVHMLLDECQAGGVDIQCHTPITDISHGDGFEVRTERGLYRAPSLVMATGGLSIPKMGASDFAHATARRFGLGVIAPRPALVPLVLSGDEQQLARSLSGVALEVEARIGKRVFREGMIFTHRGVSGPAILQISSYWHEGLTVSLNLVPGVDSESFLLDRKRQRPKSELKTILSEIVPQRLAEAIATAQATSGAVGTMTDKKMKILAALLKNWVLTPVDSEGYAKAEVTLGGIDTKDLSSKTMQANKVPNLYYVGEAVDVTGWLGGYNFQWAWSSGWAAGSAL